MTCRNRTSESTLAPTLVETETENTYIAFIFERVSSSKPALIADYYEVFEEYQRLRPNTLFKDFAQYCALRLAQAKGVGESKAIDAVLCEMQEVPAFLFNFR